MRISELAQRADLPVATVKFYLREHLLPSGRATAATQAEYDETHLARLRLVRALVGAAGLSLATVRSVLEVIDGGAGDVPTAVATVHEALGAGATAGEQDTARALDLLADLGWTVHPGSAAVRGLGAALTALTDAGFAIDAQTLRPYAQAARAIAESEVGRVPQHSPEDAAAYVVLGTILYEPVLLALRRLAQAQAFTAAAPAADHPTQKAPDR